MNILHLRQMSRKSVFESGRHEGLSVQQIIDLSYHTYLGYVYFHYDKISFLPDILIELRITDEYVINKPGKNINIFKKWKNHFYDKFELLDRIKLYAHSKKNKKKYLKYYEKLTDKNKAYYQRKNRNLKIGND